MNKYKARLKDINSLEFAENKAKSRLSLIRRSMVRRCARPCCSRTCVPFPAPREFAARRRSGVPVVCLSQPRRISVLQQGKSDLPLALTLSSLLSSPFTQSNPALPPPAYSSLPAPLHLPNHPTPSSTGPVPSPMAAPRVFRELHKNKSPAKVDCQKVCQNPERRHRGNVVA